MSRHLVLNEWDCRKVTVQLLAVALVAADRSNRRPALTVAILATAHVLTRLVECAIYTMPANTDTLVMVVLDLDMLHFLPCAGLDPRGWCGHLIFHSWAWFDDSQGERCTSNFRLVSIALSFCCSLPTNCDDDCAGRTDLVASAPSGSRGLDRIV